MHKRILWVGVCIIILAGMYFSSSLFRFSDANHPQNSLSPVIAPDGKLITASPKDVTVTRAEPAGMLAFTDLEQKNPGGLNPAMMLRKAGVIAWIRGEKVPVCPKTFLFDSVGDSVEGKPCLIHQLVLAPDSSASSSQEKAGEEAWLKNLLADPVSYAQIHKEVQIFDLAASTLFPDDAPTEGISVENRDKTPLMPFNALALVQMDAESNRPQILVGGYSGGAHCCETVKIFWSQPGQVWQNMTLSEGDGDQLPPIKFLPRQGGDSGMPVFDVGDESLIYTFSSYANSYLLPRYMAFADGRLEEVTHKPAYKPLLLEDFQYQIKMLANQQDCATALRDEPNGFLAYYASMMSLLGYFPEAWHYVLLHQKKMDMPKLRDLLLKNNYITQEDFNRISLTAELLPAEEKARFSPVESLFSMLPESFGHSSLAEKFVVQCFPKILVKEHESFQPQ